MAKSKRAGKAHTSGYARYASGKLETSNRIRKLTKLAKENPNNEQLPLAIKNVAHRRHVPKTPFWSSSMRRVAQLVKVYTGKFDKNVFNADPVVFAAAIRARNENWFPIKDTKSSDSKMFSLKERAVWK